MTEEELASQPGGVATRSGQDPEAEIVEPVFTPKDFKLNLTSRMKVIEGPLTPVVAEPLPTVAGEPVTDLDNPSIRKLTWEHVVPDLPVTPGPGPTPAAAPTQPLPPPHRVASPVPPPPVAPLQPPPPVVHPEPAPEIIEETVAEETVAEEPVAEEPVAEPPRAVVAPVRVVEPEVNRLAFVPDLIDDDSPIELPTITPSGPIIAHPQSVYTPVLAETLYVPPPQRVVKTPIALVAADPKAQRRQPGRKPKRHLLRTFMTLVLLFGLLAGGAFAAKKYLLHQPKWTPEMKPLADAVATTRDLQFKVAVDVTEIPVADYATRLAQSTTNTVSDHAPVWRALGVLNGELDLQSIGLQAVNDSPAFYDPSTKTIFVSSDLEPYEHLYRFALHRALTMALLDQQFGWSSRVAVATPSEALAIRAIVDGDALTVANTLSAGDAPDQLAPELLSFVQAHGTTVSTSQFATAVAGRAGVTMRPTIEAMASDPVALAALEQSSPGSDGVLDTARAPSTVAAPPATQGMMFWYYVLASRIDDSQAWAAAQHWMGDSMATSTGTTSQCVDATVAAADADGAAVMLGAFQAWAAAAPAESTTTVAAADGNAVAIRACDPGAAVTAALVPKVPVVFGGAGVERALVQAAISAASGSTVDATCLVTAARARGTALTSPADDAPVIAVGWQSAYVAANLDLAAACIPPAG